MHFKESASYASLAGNAERRQHPVSFDRGFDWKRAFMGNRGRTALRHFRAGEWRYFSPGYLWLQKKKKETSGQERRFSLGAAVKLLAVGVIFQMIVSLLLAGMQVVFPKAMESYAQVLENLGVFAPSVFSVLYTVVFAPLTEEMVFRGVTLRILQEELPFAAANVLQAVLFALMHGNLVQSSYAFLAGLLLGTVVKRYGKLSAAIWCHFAVNASGLFLGDISVPGIFLLLGISFGVLLVFVIIDKKMEKTNEKYRV